MRSVLLLGLVLALPAVAQTPALTLETPLIFGNSLFGEAVAVIPNPGPFLPDYIAVGAALEGTGGGGRVYVFDSVTGALVYTLDSPNPESGGVFGRALLGVVDFEGDGYGDLIVSAKDEDDTLTNDGRVYVFKGDDGTLAATLTSPDAQNAGSFGTALAERIGSGGRSDLLIGADSERAPDGSSGQVHLVRLGGAAVSTILSPTGVVSGRFGNAIALLDDVDGNGVDDLAIGASSEGTAPEDQGVVHIFDGVTLALVRTIASPVPEADAAFGAAVTALDDVDGDGVGDLVVGAPSADLDGVESGRAFVFSGATGTPIAALDSPTPKGGSAFGRALASGDLDGDGVPEILVGAPGEGPFFVLNEQGAVHLYRADGSLSGTYVSPALIGPSATNGLGTALAINAEALVVGTFNREVLVYPRSVDATTSLDGPEGWRLLAAPGLLTPAALLAPLHTQGVPGAATSDGDPSVYVYVEPTTGARDAGFVPVANLRDGLPVGRGLAVYVFADDDPFQSDVQGDFPKTLAVGPFPLTGATVPLSVSYTDTGALSEDGWNLVGNPYTTAIDWDAAEWTKTGVDNTIYVYDAADGVYKTWNGTIGGLGSGVIAPFQGFWVKAFEAPELIVPAEAETADPPGVAAAASTLSIEVSGLLAAEPVADAVHVAFLDGARAGLDPLDGYELTPFRAAFVSLFTAADGAALDVSALPPPDGAVDVPIGVYVAGGASEQPLTLTWPDLSALPSAWSLTLRDTETGATVDLRTTASYTFTTASATGRRALSGPPVPEPLFASATSARRSGPRFVLTVAASAVSSEAGPEARDEITSVRPNPSSGRVAVVVRAAAAGAGHLSVHDALGREVAVLLDGPVAAGEREVALDTAGLAAGVYIVRWASGGAVATRTLTVLR